MKLFSFTIASFLVLLAFLSTETLCAYSGYQSDSHSDSHYSDARSNAHSDQVVNSRRTRRRLNTSGKGPNGGAHSDNSSPSSSSYFHQGSSSGLTPISDTDSAQSVNSKRIAPGSAKFHNHAYEFYDAKEKYHKVMGNAYDFRSRNTLIGQKHWKASTSSTTKKVKHRKNYQGIKSNNLQPGPIEEKKGMRKIPKVPTFQEASRMISSRKYIFNNRKGHRYLQAKKLPPGQHRPYTLLDQVEDSDRTSADTS